MLLILNLSIQVFHMVLSPVKKILPICSPRSRSEVTAKSLRPFCSQLLIAAHSHLFYASQLDRSSVASLRISFAAHSLLFFIEQDLSCEWAANVFLIAAHSQLKHFVRSSFAAYSNCCEWAANFLRISFAAQNIKKLLRKLGRSSFAARSQLMSSKVWLSGQFLY